MRSKTACVGHTPAAEFKAFLAADDGTYRYKLCPACSRKDEDDMPNLRLFSEHIELVHGPW